MDRIARLQHNFMESSDRYESSAAEVRWSGEVIVHYLMPDDEEARLRMASAIRRSPALRARVEVDLARREGIEGRRRYPEAYI